MIAETLAEFAAIKPIPERAMNVMRLSLLDWCAVGCAGVNEPVSRILRDQAIAEGGTPQASMFGTSTRAPARMAALVNGTISHAIDYDDTHFAHIGHPSVAVIPAALAAAQASGATGQALQEAALIGMEASIRVGLWLGRAHYQVGFHQTATAGAFGATLAAARLLGLSKAQTVMALGLVSTRASGLKSQFGTMGKPMNAGIAASNGIEAAQFAERGFMSAPEGVQGFGATHHAAAADDAWTGLGMTWHFEQVSHKFHACCHGLHAMLEALAPVVGCEASMIERIEIETHPRWLSVCNLREPETGLEAKFSYRMTAAMRLLGYDTGRPDTFSDTACRDADLAGLRDKVEVSSSETLSEMQVRISLRRTDGTTESLFHDLNKQLSLAERQERILAKAGALVGATEADQLWDMISTCASVEDLAQVLAR